MTTFLFDGARISDESVDWQQRLADAYRRRLRPMCSCVADGLPMYIAYYGMYMLKRMPDTGPQHHPSCDSFEPEAGLSGRGDLGASIQVDAEQRIHVTTNFSLSKRSRLSEPSLAEPQAPAASQGLPAPSPRTPKCSLAGLLHLLWDEAGFNRWHPKMQGKRWQATLHKYLTQEAQRVEVNGIPLAERLYVPEPWRVADKDAIAERRRQHLAFLDVGEDAEDRPFGLVIGEFLRVDDRFDKLRLFVKHAADTPIRISKGQWERLDDRFRSVLRAASADWSEEQRPYVVIAAVISAARFGTYQLETASMMLVSHQWIPVESSDEINLVERLVGERRVFSKPLSYGGKSAIKLPNALLLDCGEKLVHLHYLHPGADEAERAVKLKVVKERATTAWLWDGGASPTPLPRAARSHNG